MINNLTISHYSGNIIIRKIPSIFFLNIEPIYHKSAPFTIKNRATQRPLRYLFFRFDIIIANFPFNIIEISLI